MSQVDTVSPSEHPERPYELRRRRVRRRAHRTKAEELPGDPRVLRVGIWAIVAGVVLVVLLACSGGSGGVGTPTVSVSGAGSGVSVGNHTGAAMRVYAWSVFPLGVGSVKPEPGESGELANLPGSRFLVLIGGTRNAWPFHFWFGMVDSGGE